MHLVVNKVVQLEEVHNADRDVFVKFFAGASVDKGRFAVGGKAGFFKGGSDVVLMSAVKDGSHNLPAELTAGKAEVNLKNLTDVHTRGNAEGVKHNVKRSAVLKEGHILLRKNS